MQDIRFSLLVDGVEIPAALTAPPNPALALLLIPGSLNSDVDGNFAPMFPGQPPSSPHLYLDLATQLAGLGIAVLRFSKGGPGTGCIVRDQAEAGARYQVFGQRMRVAEAFLAELRRRLPGLACIAAGHSEGAVVATLLAQSQPALAGLVLLSGPAKPLLQLMVWQRYELDRRDGAATPERESAYREALAWAADFAAARPLPADLSRNPYATMFSFFAQPGNAVYLRSVEQVDPVAEFARVRQPALLIQGGRDTSVLPENADLLLQARPDAQPECFPDLQHFYKRAPEGLSAQESFLLETESDPAVARAIAAWSHTIIAGGAPNRR